MCIAQEQGWLGFQYGTEAGWVFTSARAFEKRGIAGERGQIEEKKRRQGELCTWMSEIFDLPRQRLPESFQYEAEKKFVASRKGSCFSHPRGWRPRRLNLRQASAGQLEPALRGNQGSHEDKPQRIRSVR